MKVREAAPLAAGPPARGRDLLRVRLLRRFLAGPYYPVVFQGPMLALFGVILFFAFWGPDRGGANFATAVIWILWWPLLPIFLVLLGRVWCAVCPLATITALAQKAAPALGRTPGAFLRRYGVWLMSFAFIALTWADRVWNITGSPRATGLVFLVLLAGALAVALAYQRHTWCRYLCPIGALTSLYGMVAPVALRARPERCRRCHTKDCFGGNARAAGCPLWEFPRTMESNRHCNLCANCIKSCPHGSLALRLRPPAQELMRVHRPAVGEAFFAVLLAAIVYLQGIDMTLAWGDYMKWLLESTPLYSYSLAFSLTFLGGLALVVGLYLGAVALSSRLGGEGIGVNFASFGYAYLPLALGGHLGHNLGHLLGEGPRAVETALGQLGLPLALAPAGPGALSAGQPLMVGVLLLGIGSSLLSAWKTGQAKGPGARATLPHLALLLLLSLLFLVMFLLPMNPRHSH